MSKKLTTNESIGILSEVLDDIVRFDTDEEKIDYILEITDQFRKKADKQLGYDPSDGSYPLNAGHMCFPYGHNMMPVCIFQHERFAEGTNKCTRCGHTENWRYDFK